MFVNLSAQWNSLTVAAISVCEFRSFATFTLDGRAGRGHMLVES
jgi:hypothetical protein